MFRSGRMLWLKARPSPSPRVVVREQPTTPARKNAVEGWVNTMLAVGIVQEVRCGWNNHAPAAELRMTLTENVMSIDHSPTAPKYLCEKSTITVMCVGDHWKDLVQREVRPHQVVHVMGRLVLRPMFVAQSSSYEYRHELNVCNQCGDITVIRGETLAGGK